jgi:hypothetical protein
MEHEFRVFKLQTIKRLHFSEAQNCIVYIHIQENNDIIHLDLWVWLHNGTYTAMSKSMLVSEINPNMKYEKWNENKR